jgi:ABC-type multidrug transport system ATPase subunit
MNNNPVFSNSLKPPKELVRDNNIAIKGLFYAYKGLEIFRDFSLHADSKTIVLRGPSGCGKTTLLKLLSGNLTPDKATTMPPTANSCLVLQEDSLFPWLSGTENICVMTRFKANQFTNHPMHELIAPFVDRKACQMSYGQRRLVELFRAIIYRPRYLYLDEPFNFLDEKRMGLVIPYLQGEFMAGINLTMTNHHRDDLDLIKSANIFHFNGEFPISQLETID